jgi:hypothetical protein
MSGLTVDFLRAFKKEPDLREAVRALLGKMPGVRDVQLTHGTQEFGKDIVFFAPDFMGNLQLHACVIKSTRIDGSIKETGARDVLIQALQCFDTPHVNRQGQSEYIARVFIISPHDCPPTTMHSISGALQQRAGLVKFLCGQALIDAFSEYWPDFLLFYSSALNIYIASITRNVLGKDPVHFLLKNHQLLSGELKSLQERYVDQGFMKTIQERVFALSPTDFSVKAFLNPVMLADTKSLAAYITSLASIDESEIMGPIGGPGLAGLDKLADLAQDMILRWTDSFETLQRSSPSDLKNTIRRSEIAVAIGDDFYKRWSAEIRAVHDFVVEFQTKNSALTGLFAAGAGGRRLTCDDRLYRVATELDDLARFVPAILTPTGKEMEVKLDKGGLINRADLHLLITAPAGYGKTSFCRIHAMRDALALGEKESNRVPVYVSLHSLATEKIHERTFLELPESGNLIGAIDSAHLHWTFYLDGLDEIADKDQRIAILTVARRLTEQMPLARVIITSRDYLGGTSLQWLTRVELAGLEEDEVSELAKKWLNSPDDLEAFFSQLEASRTLGKLMRVPLLATLILAVFKKRKSLPTSKSALYTTFIELLCGGWDYVKSVNRDSEYGRHEKIAVLTRFAGSLHFNKLRHGNESHFRSAIADVSPTHLPSSEDLMGEMIEDGLIQRSGKNLVFAHLSFQEFLAAKELGDPSGERNNVVLLDFLRGDDWWREVLSFYVATHNRPDETERWIRRAADKVEQSGVNCRSREKFLLGCMEESWPGWGAKLLAQQLEAKRAKSERA